MEPYHESSNNSDKYHERNILNSTEIYITDILPSTTTELGTNIATFFNEKPSNFTNTDDQTIQLHIGGTSQHVGETGQHEGATETNQTHDGDMNQSGNAQTSLPLD